MRNPLIGFIISRKVSMVGIVIGLVLLTAPGAVLAQLSPDDIEALRERGKAEGWTFTVGENSATSRSLDELCGLVVPEDWRKNARFNPCTPGRLPEAFNWRTEVGCPPVENQGSCGSCWAFGTTGPLECNILIKDGDVVDIAEQWLVSCNTDGWGCNGGWLAHDYHQWKTDVCGGTGGVLEEYFPYTASDAPCDCPYPHDYLINDWAFIGGEWEIPPAQNIKQAIYDYGPVSACLCADSAFQGYNGGVFDDCSGGSINHAVTLVGWDDNQGSNGVWILRNSWGSGWGEGGYMRMEYGCSSIGYGSAYIDYAGASGLRVKPYDDFTSAGPGGGPFSPESEVYTLQNMGDYGFDYNATHTESWVTVTNSSGHLDPDEAADVTVSINSNAESLSPGSYYDTVSFVNTTTHEGDTSRQVVLHVGTPSVWREWLLDTDPGWTTEGMWAFGQPTGGGGGGGAPDPTSGYTGNNVYGYNLNGNYANNLPETHLTTTAIDCSDLSYVHLNFQRWLGCEHSFYDRAYVRVSNDGTNWITVWQNRHELTESSWLQREYDISSLADHQPTVYLRWTMGETDGGTTYCGWNIDDIQLTAIGPPLVIEFPEGLPAYIDPGVPTPITVQIADGSQEYAPGTGTLHYRYDGGTYLTSPLTHLTEDLYEATLPPADCNALPEYYFIAEGDGGGIVLSPKDAPGDVYTAMAGSFTTIMEDSFETDQGWTVGDVDDDATTGIWNRADPEGTAAQPEDDNTPDPGTQCWVTDSRAGAELGTWDVDDGKTTLISPTINLDVLYDATISYYRWYSNDAGPNPNSDVFVVDISDDNGQTWTNVETVGPSGEGTSGGWIFHEFQVSNYVWLTDQVKVRFVASDEGDASIIEAAIDDFKVVAFRCDPPAACDDGILNQGEERIDCGGPCPPCECTSDGMCGNGAFCDGEETCDEYGDCQAGTNPCTDPGAPYCNEGDDLCLAFGDCDGDGDVDLADFLAFQSCYTGPVGPVNPGCECANFDGDDDVDLADFLAFQSAYTGPG